MKEFDIIKKYFRPLSKNNYGAMNLTDDVYFDLKKILLFPLIHILKINIFYFLVIQNYI